MRTIGIDPGVHGGLAALEFSDGAAPVLIDAIDVPTTGIGAKERVDALAVRSWIRMHQPQHVYIERAGSMPRQGVASTFKYARAVGTLEGVIACCEIPMTIVEPAMWKRAYRLPGKDKEAARQIALQLFPTAHALLARKMDHGRAEGALIALYGGKHEHESTPG